MVKIKSLFVCNNCGATSPKWLGKCPSCQSWNTLVEEIVSQKTSREKKKEIWSDASESSSSPTNINEIDVGKTTRTSTNDSELDRVLGGGLVRGSLILVGGQPGIGKSTLMLQVALKLDMKVLYVSGEESEEQIKMRASRISQSSEKCYVLTISNLSKILKESKKLEAQLVVIDSIQTVSSQFVESAPGSVSQIRECTAEIQKFAKETNTPVIIIGHITKDGAIAGPKLLEHIVDVVLQFEGDRNHAYRILRTIKNRFGSTDELGIYEMLGSGLRQVPNPSELFLNQHSKNLSGSSVAATIEGLRPMLIETQALVSTSPYGTPQRSATGFDLRRLSMLLAVLEKRCGLFFAQNDVFLNIAGGLKVSDPSIDLSIVAALISSLQDIPVSNKICFAGEVGLSGEIRAVNRLIPRIQEAQRLGFDSIYVSSYSKKTIEKELFKINIVFLSTIEDLLKEVFS